MPQSKSRSILVVDDEPDIAQNLADILEDFGYAVDIAFNGPEALEKIRGRTFDVALLDFKMPGMDGLTLYGRMREQQPDIVALIVTAYASPQVTQGSLRSGVWKVLSKPVDLTRLTALVGEAASQPTIMVVDDDVDLCQSLWDLLHEHGYRVCLAHSESDTVRALSGRHFDVVLVDLKLPGGDGVEILQTIRDRDPRTRLVLITGHFEELQTRLQSLERLDADVCYKPFDVPALLKTIDELVHRSD